MFELSQRQRACLRRLYDADDFVSVDLLAQVFGVSTRTVRSDLNHIDAFLRPRGLSLSRASGKGVRLEGSSEAKARMMATLDEARALTSRDRVAIAEVLLVCRPVVTYLEIAEFCGVSKQTIVNSFAEVDRFFSAHGLAVVHEPGVGSRLQGPEAAVRGCFLALIGSEGGYGLLAPLVAGEVSGFSDDAAALVREAEELRRTTYAGKEKLILCVAFALFRAGTGHPLEPAAGRSALQDEPEAEAVLRMVARRVADPADAAYIASLMLSQHLGVESSEALRAQDDVAEAVSHELIAAVNAIHPVDLEALSQVIEGFARHIRAAIYRCRNNIRIQGEVPARIVSSFPLLYEFARGEVGRIEREHGIAFDENEVVYIAMYLDTIYEASVRESVALNVLFVCSFGLASSSILMLRLSHVLVDCNVFGPLSAKSARGFLSRNDVDLVISTSGFSCSEAPAFVVDPLLGQASLDSVKQQITNMSYQKLCSGFLRSYSRCGRSSSRSVRDLVDPSAVQVGAECPSWQSAIRMAARPLLSYGLIDKHYVDQMIAAVESYGPYMVLTPGVAYVHAGVNDGIRRSCTSILVMARPLEFGPSGDTKRVLAIVVLGVLDKDRNDLLSLASILEREESIEALERGPSVDDVLALHD